MDYKELKEKVAGMDSVDELKALHESLMGDENRAFEKRKEIDTEIDRLIARKQELNDKYGGFRIDNGAVIRERILAIILGT